MKTNRLIRTLLPYKFFWVACGLILTANFAVSVFLIRDKQNKIDGLHQQYIKIRKENAQTIEKYDGTPAQYLKIREDLKTFTNMLPPVVTIAERVRELSKVLDKHDLFVNKMTFKPDKTTPLSLWKYTTSFTVAGQYAELKVLLSEIQNLPGLFCIESIFFNSPQDKEVVDMQLRIATYFK